MTTLRVEPARRGAVRRLLGRGTTLSVAPTAAVLGVLAALGSWLGSWNPSYWGDEAATVMSAQRPIGVLLAELRNIDAVHGLYYLIMHFWIGVFGSSELATRAPSAIAVGVLVAGIVVLGSRLAGLRFGIIAGVVCAVLPRTTFLATEARSYAIGTAIAVWVTVSFVGLWRRRDHRVRSWLLYGAAVGLASYLFLYLILLVVVHGAVLLATAPDRRMLGRWFRAAVVAGVVAIPIAALAYSERHQVAFLAVRGYATPSNVLVAQWFGDLVTGGWAVPLLCWALILLGLAVVCVRSGRRSPDAVLENRTSDREVVLLGVAWLAIPTAALLVGNAVIAPMYNIRYLSFSTPAAALLIAVGAVAAGRLLTPLVQRGWARVRGAAVSGRRISAVVLAGILLLIAVLAVPGYLAQRGPFAKNGGSDWRQTADYVQSHADSDDAVVFQTDIKPSQRPELAYRLYPTQFSQVDAVQVSTPYYERAAIWDVVQPLADVQAELASARTVWALEIPVGVAKPHDITELTSHGYRVVDEHRIHRIVVYELQKETA